MMNKLPKTYLPCWVVSARGGFTKFYYHLTDNCFFKSRTFQCYNEPFRHTIQRNP